MSIDDVRKSVIPAHGVVSKLGAEMAGGFVTAVGAAAVGIFKLNERLVDLSREGVIAGDVVVKLAQSFGLAVDDLQGLQYAAEQMGSSAASIQTGLTRMTANVYDFSKGIGEAKESFEQLGLTSQEFQGLNAYDQFIKIANAISRVQDSSTKAAIAYEIFGRKGVELLNTLTLGRDGIEAFKKEADELGAIMTGKTAEGLAYAKGELDKFTAARRGFDQVRSAAVGALSPMDKLSQWWYTRGPTRWFYEQLNGPDVFDEMGKSASGASVQIQAAMKAAENSIQDAAKAKSQQSGARYFYDLLGDLKDQAAGIDDLTRALIKMDAEVGFTAEQYKEILGVIEKIKKLQDKMKADEDIAKNTKDPLSGAVDNYSGSVEIFRSANIDLRGLQSNQDPNTFILKEMLAIQRKAFN